MFRAFTSLLFSRSWPENLWAGMVDQDEANGNVSRTKILLNKYMNLEIVLEMSLNMI